MSITVNVSEVTAKFSELLSQVLLGEEVVIAQKSILVARLVVTDTASPRVPGLDKGKVREKRSLYQRNHTSDR